MTITKPFTFAAGTKARANEVNTNFDVLYAQVNTNISDIASLSNEISGFDLTKADVNGSALNTFAVKDPVNSSDAVNKGYLETQMSGVAKLSGNQTLSGLKTFSVAPLISSSGYSSAVGRILAIADRKTSGNACLKLSDGTMVQWGRNAGKGTRSQNFTPNFSSAPVVLVCNMSQYVRTNNTQVYSISASTCTIVSEDHVEWIAIGR